MKRYTLIYCLSIPLVALTSSCSKTQNCECSYQDISGETVIVQTVELEGSKKKIKEACESKKADWDSVNGSCTVKEN